MKSKDKIYAERLNESKTTREDIMKDAVKEHKDHMPKPQPTQKIKFTKKGTL
ncbi:MAG: hypothetical protein ACK5NA_00065 [Enterococcus sp.]